MRFFYGDRNILRVLDEMEFWKRQESEHTVVIRTIIPNLEDKFVKHLEYFENKFYKTESEAVKFIETVIRSGGNISPDLNAEIMCLIEYATRESECFVQLIEDILQESKGAKDNPVAKTVLNHIRRESEYFIGIVQTILYRNN